VSPYSSRQHGILPVVMKGIQRIERSSPRITPKSNQRSTLHFDFPSTIDGSERAAQPCPIVLHPPVDLLTLTECGASEKVALGPDLRDPQTPDLPGEHSNLLLRQNFFPAFSIDPLRGAGASSKSLDTSFGRTRWLWCGASLETTGRTEVYLLRRVCDQPSVMVTVSWLGIK
jgi:hypothetical protein